MSLKSMFTHCAIFCLTILVLSGCQTSSKNRMVKGDIPLSIIPAGTFVEPTAELKPIFQTILFDYDSSTLRRDMLPTLKQIANWLQTNTKIMLRIEGHCDERGTEEYNLALGERRALSIRKFLADHKVTPERMITISYGEERPANPDHNEIAWAENRRVNFLLSQ